MPIRTLWIENFSVTQMQSGQNRAVLRGHPDGQSGQKSEISGHLGPTQHVFVVKWFQKIKQQSVACSNTACAISILCKINFPHQYGSTRSQAPRVW
jgi:hypothetical protein